MVALVCPDCRSYLLVADRPAGSLVHCQTCRGKIAVPADAPADRDMVKAMRKAIRHYGHPNLNTPREAGSLKDVCPAR
jgi:ribosomal protein L37AE/L43A